MADEGERLAFIKAVCRDPADDLLRTVYADWLDENGDPERAEFVRVQVEVPKHPGKCVYANPSWGPNNLHQRGACGWCDMRHRERELLERNRTVWEYGFPWAEFGWSRGFVSEVTCTAEDAALHLDSLTWCWAKCVPCGARGRNSHQKMNGLVCPTCSGAGRVPPKMELMVPRTFDVMGKMVSPGGTVLLPRPCPPTAQPIEVVRLTTMPPERSGGYFPKSIGTGDFVNDYWPGVTFHLPQRERTRGPRLPVGLLPDTDISHVIRGIA
jgi:uncharacterized protein (TIGR02996 family)